MAAQFEAVFSIALASPDTDALMEIENPNQ